MIAVTTSAASASRARRQALDHPVIDSLMHSMEYIPVLEDFLHAVGGVRVVERFRAARRAGRFQSNAWYGMSPAERARRRMVRPAWWGFPSARTIDLAAVSLPALLQERLPEHGVDFAVVYSNAATFAVHVDDPDLRIPLCRAVNLYQAEMFAKHAGRLCAAAAIPLYTPQEGIEELDFAFGRLGLKAALISGGVHRPIAELAALYPADRHPALASSITWFDTFGVDSAYDYDPFWSRAIEVGAPLAVHRGAQGWPGRASISNYTHNQVGHFAMGHEALARSLFFGGVTRRFPRLRLSLLEGGAAAGDTLLGDIVGAWRRRGAGVIGQFDPAALDANLLFDLFARYGDEHVRAALDTPEALCAHAFGLGEAGQGNATAQEQLDDFLAVGAETEDDLVQRFRPNFYYGCEADDPPPRWACEPAEGRVRAVWATDGGHWDVPDLTAALDVTWSHVEAGCLSETDFGDLVWSNPARFFLEANGRFFDGTALAQRATAVVTPSPSRISEGAGHDR